MTEYKKIGPDFETVTPTPAGVGQDWIGQKPAKLSVIGGRSLERECFRNCLAMEGAAQDVVSYASIEDWRADTHVGSQVILLNLGAGSMLEDAALDRIRALVDEAGGAPVIAMSETGEISAVLAALDAGAAGHIPPGAEMADVVEAIHVALSGGVFLPRASIGFLRRAVATETDSRQDGLDSMFTERQLAVARALQRGAANKTIAYELNLCESTVKVHIRNIMRKLNATNRTQAAYRLTEQIGVAERRSS